MKSARMAHNAIFIQFPYLFFIQKGLIAYDNPVITYYYLDLYDLYHAHTVIFRLLFKSMQSKSNVVG